MCKADPRIMGAGEEEEGSRAEIPDNGGKLVPRYLGLTGGINLGRAFLL